MTFHFFVVGANAVLLGCGCIARRTTLLVKLLVWIARIGRFGGEGAIVPVVA